ncbi:MAG: hypothetical protein EA406_09900 [Rhodospirillales bacterium]|nr:MAG: hypothetical protein EA406_09900 [Rhodospirillales bacterium]
MTSGDEAIVVFTDATSLTCLRVLKPGFRHCFVSLRRPQGWILIDPLSHKIDTFILEDVQTDQLLSWCRNHDCTAIRTRVRVDHRQSWVPVAPLTCVEVVKRVLGIQRRRIVTPWQLFCHLREQGAVPS